MDEFLIELQAKLDEAKSKGNVNSDISKIQNQIDKLKIQAEIDPKTISNLVKQLETVLNQKINISNIGINQSQVIKAAQQTGQQIGNAINQGIANTTSKVNNTLKSFTDLRNFSELNKSISNIRVDSSELKNYKSILDDVKNTYAEFGQVRITNEIFKDGVLEKFKVNIEQVNGDLKETKSFMMGLNDEKDAFVFRGLISGSENIVQHLDKTKNAVNQTTDAINALKEKAQIDNIQLLTNGGIKDDYSTQIAKLEGNFRSLGLTEDKIQEKTSNVTNAFDTLKTRINQSFDESNYQEIISLNDKLQKELIESGNEYTKLQSSAKGFVSMQQRLSKANTIEAWNQKNHAATTQVISANNAYIDSLRDLNTQMTKMQFNEIADGFKRSENSMRSLGKLGASFKEQMSQAAESFTQWASVSSAIMAVVYQLQKMPQKVRELDDAITDFTMATGANKAQVSELINTYADLGDELSATVTDVTVSATEWLKQGKSIAETETLIKDAMVLSKVGKLSSADSTKYLTSVMKSYKVTAEDTLGVVDKLSAVDMASATDVGGLAEGISTVANNARLAGVSMDKLLGYLAAVGEVSQEGMSGVGTAYNAIFARMGNIKLSRLKDYETGEDLSNVETVLKGVGIQLRDSQNSFRNFDEVLDETASRWTSFSEVQQRAIANAFAGTHHVDSFITLMENYDNALKYSEVSMSSSGQAMEKFTAYEDSMAGHTEKLENAFIQLSNTFLDSEFLKGIIDLGTTGIKSIDSLINALTPLGTISAIGGGIAGAKNLG